MRCSGVEPNAATRLSSTFGGTGSILIPHPKPLKTMVDFQKQVIERSFIRPVLVDFWAAWCGPCRILGPILDQLAKENQGKWELVKIDTEEQPDLAQKYRVMSIPNVKLFHKGRVIAEFAGALPKSQVERWLAQHLPRPEAGELETLLNSIEALPLDQAIERLRKFLQDHPDNKQALVALAQRVVFADPVEAKKLVESIQPGHELADAATDIRTLVELVELQPDNGSRVAELLLQAKDALAKGEKETAIQRIIEAVGVDKHYHEDLPRRSAIALFHLWGEEHELTKKYRRQFSMALY